MKEIFILIGIVSCLNSYCQNCSLTVLTSEYKLVDFAIKWGDSTIPSKNGKLIVDSSLRKKIGHDKVKIILTNGMDKKLYFLPNELSIPVNLREIMCKEYILRRRNIR